MRLLGAILALKEQCHVAAALSAFDSVWDALIPTEQTRILGLLTERIVYDGRPRTLELVFRRNGIGRLHELQKLNRSGAPGVGPPGAPL